jgi:hypothetical protein
VSLPSYEDALDRAADRMAFSNGTEGDAWMARWCYRCVHEEDCPLLLVALLGKTPASWQEQDRMSLGNQYRCIEFRALS